MHVCICGWVYMSVRVYMRVNGGVCIYIKFLCQQAREKSHILYWSPWNYRKVVCEFESRLPSLSSYCFLIEDQSQQWLLETASESHSPHDCPLSIAHILLHTLVGHQSTDRENGFVNVFQASGYQLFPENWDWLHLIHSLLNLSVQLNLCSSYKECISIRHVHSHENLYEYLLF